MDSERSESDPARKDDANAPGEHDRIVRRRLIKVAAGAMVAPAIMTLRARPAGAQTGYVDGSIVTYSYGICATFTHDQCEACLNDVTFPECDDDCLLVNPPFSFGNLNCLLFLP